MIQITKRKKSELRLTIFMLRSFWENIFLQVCIFKPLTLLEVMSGVNYLFLQVST